MTRKCICQICTCGRHRCPHNPRGVPTTHAPCTFSEYTNKFTVHPIEMRKNFKPQEKPVAGQGPLDDKTTHRVDYVPHPVERHQAHQGEKYQPPEGEMDTMTNYTKEFTQKPLELVKPVKRQETRKVVSRFEGEPTYTSDYRKWGMQPRERVTADNTYHPPENPFEGNSNYQTDYIKHPGGVRQSMKPNEAPKISDQPFDDATDYRESYVKHQLPSKQARAKTVWEPNPARFDDLSNYRKEYILKAAGKQASCKPEAVPIKSTVPFDSDTTQRADFIEWPTERFHAREHEPYQKPEGMMQLDTTTATDFNRKPIERQAAVRQQETRKVVGKFDGTTNYTTEFRRWPTEVRRSTAKEAYQPNAAPFEGLATYQRDFISHPGAGRTVSLKPVDKGYSSGAPLEDFTEYRSEYIRKQASPCPANYLDSGKDVGFAFSDQDDRGHKWYSYIGKPAVRA